MVTKRSTAALTLFFLFFLPEKKKDAFEALALTNVSSIAKFLQEPKLGTSWFNPAGPTPNFVAGQKNGTVYRARLGSDALLSCRVTALERNLVSWSRVDSSSGLPELLTVGFRPHSGENRFILDLAQPNDHRLRISNVQWRDAGIYLCQLSVHPPAILVSRLQLVKPVVNIIDFTTSVSAPRELYYDSGTTIELACRVRLAPMGGASIMWQVAHAEGTRILNMDVTRGGVRVVTGREPDAGWIVSRLSLAWARAGDAGNYTCTLTGVPPALKYTAGLSDTVYVHVLQGDNTEAIYSKGSARSSSMLLLLLFSLTTRRICT